MNVRWMLLPVLFAAIVLGFTSAGITVAHAQPPAPDGADATPLPLQIDSSGKPKLNIPDTIPGLDFGGDNQGPRLFLNARFELEEGKSTGRLLVTGEMPPGFHTYSLTQKKTADGLGPNATKLTLLPTTDAKLLGPFSADTAPHVHVDTAAWVGLSLEEHEGAVTWSAPIELAAGVDPAKVTLQVEYDGQVCKDDCLPIKQVAEAKFAGTYMLAAATGEYKPKFSHLVWKGSAEPKVVAPGGTVTLTFTATTEAPFHVYSYSYAKKDDKQNFASTRIAFQKTSGFAVHAAEPDAKVIVKPSPVKGSAHLTYHEGTVSWQMKLDVPANAALGEHELTGLIGFQTCQELNCDMPEGAQFRVGVQVGKQSEAGAALMAFEPSSYKKAEDLAVSTASQLIVPAAGVGPVAVSELATAIVFALLGGFILNLMPCVLPVIGLKVIQFAEQAGQDRAKVLKLNFAYCAGLMTVFMVLASLGVFLNLGWGEHFGVLWFQVAVTCVMFAMALSFMGVWEIPLPGFVGGAQTNALQKQEGYSGAFFKGVITTILATPCSGPLLGAVFSLTLRYPAWATYLIFFCVGVGMAFPYVAIGAIPGLAKMLPKPGAWMETLKQVMGFVLLGAVVFFFIAINAEYRVATLTLLFAIWFACWWVGRTPVYAETSQKFTAWAGGAVAAAAIGWVAFTYLGPHDAKLDWVPYSPAALAQAQAEGKTVMIEFTAKWCSTCQVNNALAIDTQAVKELVDQNRVVTMLADWSDRGEQIKQKLAELDSNSIPLIAVYPASGDKPIVLRDLVIQSQVIGALEQAGPSQQGKAAAAMASRE